jgi:hypothetical protein
MKPPISFDVPHTGEKFTHTLADFVQHRKEKRKKITPKSAELISKLLSKYPESVAIEMLETSIRNGWQGVFPPRNGAALYEPTLKEQAFGAMVGRGHRDRCTQQERDAIDALGEVSEDEFDTMERFYNAIIPADRDKRRQTLLALVQNWPGELDKARNWKGSR